MAVGGCQLCVCWLGGMAGGEATSLKLSSASLQLYALSDTAFGGYLAQLPAAEEWNEETTVWNDYVNIG